MKELSIEEKAKRYDEALNRCREFYETIGNANLKEEVEEIFPELKESEGERIRKSLIDMLKNDEKCYLKEIAWLEKQGKKDEEILILKDQIESLHAAIKAIKETHRIELEKQGEHANFRNKIQIGDKVTRNEDGVLVNLSQLNRVTKKQGEQKPAWKPSDEQIECLSDAIKHYNSLGYPATKLKELLDDLKKLMEK